MFSPPLLMLKMPLRWATCWALKGLETRDTREMEREIHGDTKVRVFVFEYECDELKWIDKFC